MRKKWARVVSFLLAIALVMQDSAMTVYAKTGGNEKSEVVVSEVENTGEETALDADDEADKSESEPEESDLTQTGQEGANQEESNSEGADSEGTNPNEEDSEEENPSEDGSKEEDSEETDAEEANSGEADSEEADLEGTDAEEPDLDEVDVEEPDLDREEPQQETDPETGDIITYGENLFGDAPFANELSYWNIQDMAVTNKTVNDAGTGVTLEIGNGGLGAFWQTGLEYGNNGADLGLKAGSTYQVSYTIMSTVDRSVIVDFNSVPDDDRKKIQLKKNQAEVLKYEVTPAGAWNNFRFYLGKIGDEADYGAHDITITNLSIREKKIQLAPGEKPEETKDNLVKNGDFSQKDDKGEWLKDWSPSVENGNVKTAQYKVVFDLTGAVCADWQTWLKQEVKLESGAKYKIAFDIESSIDRSIIVGFDGGMWLPHKALKAKKKETVEYEVTGTTGGNFVIALGNNLRAVGDTPANNQTLAPHRIVISNVRITEIPPELPDTPNDTPYSEITNLKSYGGFTPAMMSLLKDGKFARKLKEGFWETWWENWMAEYDVVHCTQVDNGLAVYIGNTGGGEGNKPWDVQLNQKISLARNTKYVLSFKVHSEKARSINVSIADIGENGQAWVKPIAIQKGETREVILNLPEVPVDANNKLFSIQMGNVSGEVLENTLTFSDMKIEVNGYSKLAELITDGDFKDGESGSFTVTGGENIEADFSDNYLKADIKRQCSEGDAALASSEFKLLSGQEYEVSFMAGATASRTIKAAFVDTKGNVLKEQQIDLTTETQKHTFTYQAGNDVTARLQLFLGGSAEVICVDTIRCDIKGYPAALGLDTETHDIVLLEKKAFPVISEMTADQAVEGKDVVLTFKKDDDYKNAIKAITVNGTEVEYTIADGAAADEYAITLKASLFPVSGKRQVFNIVVKADWYQDNVIKQTVYRSQQWEKVWFEEFDGTELDMTKWSYQDGTGEEYGNAGWGNNEQQYYTRNNLKVNDGELVITAKKERRGNNDYTSARIWTMEDDQKTPKFSKTYGRMEAKMKLVGGEGYEGIWPAFWMLPVDTSIYGAWPLSGEIDILETRGREPDKVDGTVHFGKPWPNNESKGGVFEFSKSQNNTDSDINGYHIYAVEWEPGEIRWYVDDELFFTFSNWYSQAADKPGKYKYPAPFDQDFYIILNLAVGGSFDNNLLPDDDLMPVDMKVDYVRVYDSMQGYKEVTKEPATEKDEATDIKSVKSELYDKNFAGMNKYSDGDLQKDVWNLATLTQFGGSADFKTVTEDGQVYAKITPQALGSAAHSIQLMQNLGLVKGYNYRISFDARTEGKRKLNMKIGQDGSEGWDTHETFETTLSGTMQHYTYEFQANTTDLHARVEFNLGTSMQPVYIGNITYEIIDEIVAEEDGRKKPCDDQNYVYNGSFNIGDLDGLTYWHNDNSDAKVVREKTGYVFTATKGNLYQYGLELLQNDTYELTFLGRADEERKIKVSLTNVSGKTIYKEEEVTVNTVNGTSKIVFTMPNKVSDRDAKLCFDFGEGGSKVYLTDIFLARTTYNNVDWEEVNAYPLLNGNFELGDLYWSNSGDIGLTIKEEQEGHYAQVSTIPCANIWDRMLIYSDLHLTGKTDYFFSFDVRASKESDALLVTMEDSGYYQHVSKPNLHVGTEWTHYEYDLRFTDDMDLALKFQLGGVDEACTMDFRNVRLSAVGAPKEPGTVKADNDVYNKLGEDVVFSYSGEQEWVDNAVVYVDGKVVAAGKANFADGKLTLDKSIFTESRVYTISIEAEGYTASPEISLKMYPADGDRVWNGGFVNGFDGWDQYLDWETMEKDSISWEDGKAKIHYGGQSKWGGDGNAASWAIQFFQEGIPVESGKTYQLSFIAYADIERWIHVINNPANDEHHKYLKIGTTPQVYEVTLPAAEITTDRLKLQFLLSTVGANGEPTKETLAEHNIYLDNICIKEVKADGSVAVDKTELNQLIAECEKLQESDYTAETWEGFPEALAAAKEMAAKTDVKQAEINMARDNLLTAFRGLRKPLNTENLQKAIEEYENTERGNYTKSSWNVFQAALNTAKEMLEQTDAEQSEVDAAETNLKKAFGGLTEMTKEVLDAKEALNDTIAQLKDKEQGNYTQKSWNAFKAALKTAQDIAENEEESADRIEVAKENLEKAYAGLEENKVQADKTALKELFDEYDKVQRGNYTQDTWAVFVSALDAAERILKDEDATQDEVDAAKADLETAYKGLKKGEGSGNPENPEKLKKDLKDAIAKYGNAQPGNYPEGTWETYLDALQKAKDLADKDNATPEELKNAKANLEAAYKALGITEGPENPEKPVSKEELEKAIAEYKQVQPDGYTKESWDAFQEALEEARKVVEKNNATTEEITQAKADLDDAFNNLEREGLWADDIAPVTYTGKAIKPEFNVYDGNTKLIAGKDYTLSYKNNTKVGPATATIKGKGNYVGSITKEFTIAAKSLGDADIIIPNLYVMAPKAAKGKTPKAVVPKPVVTRDGKKLKLKTEYTVECIDEREGAYIEPGTYKVRVKAVEGKGYADYKDIDITLADPETQVLMSKATIAKISNQQYSVGEEIKPDVIVKVGKNELILNEDYTVRYENNKEIGTATVIVTGLRKTPAEDSEEGAKVVEYIGEKQATFKITGTPLKAQNVKLKEVPSSGIPYTGNAIEPEVEIDGLTMGTDYTVDYQNQLNKGTASVIVKGMGAYTGTVKKTFKIAAYDIGKDEDLKFRIVSENISVPYAKGKSKPSVQIAFGDTILTEGTDYTLSYKNNDRAGGEKQPEITIKGKGNFAGTAKTTFTITQQDIKNLQMTAADTLEKNAKKYNKVNPVVTDLDGKKLKKGTDYRVTGYIDAETAEGVNGEEIESTPEAGDIVRITLEGQGNYTGEWYVDFRIIANDKHISKAKVTVEPQDYTGKEIKPKGEAVKVTVKVKNPETKRTEVVELQEGTHYQIVEDGYSKNINKGTGKMTICGMDEYGGTKTVSFKIQAQKLDWADWFKKAQGLMELLGQ